jgi:hypothetical protein
MDLPIPFVPTSKRISPGMSSNEIFEWRILDSGECIPVLTELTFSMWIYFCVCIKIGNIKPQN